jgi:hypothetical protein
MFKNLFQNPRLGWRRGRRRSRYRYSLVNGFEHASDQEVVLEFDDDRLVCEGFEDREDQLPVTLRVEKRSWERWRGLTIVAVVQEGDAKPLDASRSLSQALARETTIVALEDQIRTLFSVAIHFRFRFIRS